MTTIGEIPFHSKQYHGWKYLVLIPYALIMFLGLCTMASLLSLSLKVVTKCKWDMICCCTCCSDNTDQEDAEEDELSCVFDYYDSEEDWVIGTTNEKEDSEIPFIKNKNSALKKGSK